MIPQSLTSLLSSNTEPTASAKSDRPMLGGDAFATAMGRATTEGADFATTFAAQSGSLDTVNPEGKAPNTAAPQPEGAPMDPSLTADEAEALAILQALNPEHEVFVARGALGHRVEEMPTPESAEPEVSQPGNLTGPQATAALSDSGAKPTPSSEAGLVASEAHPESAGIKGHGDVQEASATPRRRTSLRALFGRGTQPGARPAGATTPKAVVAAAPEATPEDGPSAPKTPAIPVGLQFGVENEKGVDATSPAAPAIVQPSSHAPSRTETGVEPPTDNAQEPAAGGLTKDRRGQTAPSTESGLPARPATKSTEAQVITPGAPGASTASQRQVSPATQPFLAAMASTPQTVETPIPQSALTPQPDASPQSALTPQPDASPQSALTPQPDSSQQLVSGVAESATPKETQAPVAPGTEVGTNPEAQATTRSGQKAQTPSTPPAATPDAGTIQTPVSSEPVAPVVQTNPLVTRGPTPPLTSTSGAPGAAEGKPANERSPAQISQDVTRTVSQTAKPESGPVPVAATRLPEAEAPARQALPVAAPPAVDDRKTVTQPADATRSTPGAPTQASISSDDTTAPSGIQPGTPMTRPSAQVTPGPAEQAAETNPTLPAAPKETADWRAPGIPIPTERSGRIPRGRQTLRGLQARTVSLTRAASLEAPSSPAQQSSPTGGQVAENGRLAMGYGLTRAPQPAPAPAALAWSSPTANAPLPTVETSPMVVEDVSRLVSRTPTARTDAPAAIKVGVPAPTIDGPEITAGTTTVESQVVQPRAEPAREASIASPRPEVPRSDATPDLRQDSREGAATNVKASAASGSGSGGEQAAGQNGGHSQETLISATGLRQAEAPEFELQSPIFELPTDPAADQALDPSRYLESRLVDALDEWFGEDSGRTELGRGTAGRRSSRSAVAAAWLRAVRSSATAATQPSDNWNEVRIQLDDGSGSVKIRARRDADQLTVQVQTSDMSTRSQLSAAAERLEEQLRDRYGADVDLSFGSESQSDPGSESQAATGPTLSGATSQQQSDSPDTIARRGADRVWVG